MIIADIFAAFFIAVLSGMGVGSGGLFVIYLTMVANAPQLTAQGLNLLFFLFSSGSALLFHMTKRKILWTAVLIMSLSGIIGACTGSLIAGILSESTVRKIFGIVFAASGVVALFAKKRQV